MDSKIGLLVQLNGVLLVTILSILLQRTMRVAALKYWSVAWLCLSFSLLSLRIGFEVGSQSRMFFTFYFLGEYVFGFLLVAGCWSLRGGHELRLRLQALILPFALAAFVLPHLAEDFNDVYNIHCLIFSMFFAAAWHQMRKTPFRGFGWHVMHVAVGFLAVDFFGYFVVFTARHFVDFPSDFMNYNSIADLVLETMLGFGMVIVLLERVLADFKQANEELQEAHKLLETVAQTDPLTAVFNRHAFYGFVKKAGNDNSITSGCVGFFDIDGLKSINDRFGHDAGDAAIRAVVRAIRQSIRAEDLIYRWGGDEFFVVMISMGARRAEERAKRLKLLLASVDLEGIASPIGIGVSCGFTDFHDASELETAVKAADAAMYCRKHGRKTERAEAAVSHQYQEIETVLNA